MTQYVRIAMILFIVALFPAGFIAGCMDEKERHDHTKAMVRAAGEAQEQKTKERIADDKRHKQEIASAHQKELAKRDARYDDLTARYLDLNERMRTIASRSVVPPGTDSSGKPVQAGGVICVDRDRLDAEITASLQRYAERFRSATARLIELVRKGEEGLDDAKWWGDFARRTQACAALSPRD